MTQWIIHLKDGRTVTDKDGYPWDFPEKDITSVERVVNGKLYTICKCPPLSHFFVKTTAGQEYSMFSGKSSPPVIMERIIGCYIEGKEGPIRLELVVNPTTGDCKLVAQNVKNMTKDGF